MIPPANLGQRARPWNPRFRSATRWPWESRFMPVTTWSWISSIRTSTSFLPSKTTGGHHTWRKRGRPWIVINSRVETRPWTVQVQVEPQLYCKLSAPKNHGNYVKSPSNLRWKRGVNPIRLEITWNRRSSIPDKLQRSSGLFRTLYLVTKSEGKSGSSESK